MTARDRVWLRDGSRSKPVFRTDGGAPVAVETLRQQVRHDTEIGGTQMATEANEQEQTAVDYLEHAVEDLKQAGQEAGGEVRSAIDSAMNRTREALDDLRSGAEERAERLRSRAENRARELQDALGEASEDARRELGIRTVRAQRNEDALDAMAEEIKRHKKELP
jgi:uncharacterized protein YicC (UPF0701 family)